MRGSIVLGIYHTIREHNIGIRDDDDLCNDDENRKLSKIMMSCAHRR